MSEGETKEKCPRCKGEGVIEVGVEYAPRGHFGETKDDCPACDGTGLKGDAESRVFDEVERLMNELSTLGSNGIIKEVSDAALRAFDELNEVLPDSRRGETPELAAILAKGDEEEDETQ